MKINFKIIISVFLIALLQSCSGLLQSEKRAGFITVEGTKFILDGKPYYFAGINFWYGCYIGSPGETGDRERLMRELDFLKEKGITNLRVLGASRKLRLKIP